jgi:hypothetical protein
LEKLNETTMRRVSILPMKFSSGRLGAGHLYSDRERGLADETLAAALAQ